jgi:hypothetical protein
MDFPRNFVTDSFDWGKTKIGQSLFRGGSKSTRAAYSAYFCKLLLSDGSFQAGYRLGFMPGT